MKTILLHCLLLSATLTGISQAKPVVKLNHLFFIISPEDLNALNESDFLKNELTAFDMRTTHANDSDVWTGVYFMGTSNYIEFLDTRYAEVGKCGFGFGVEQIGGINKLGERLKSDHEIEFFTQTKNVDGDRINWFHGLAIDHSIYSKTPLMNVWVMEYDTSYFKYRKLPYRNNSVTSEDYLSNFDEPRRGKIIKRFTGVTLKLNAFEKEYFCKFLRSIGFKRKNDSTFLADDFYFSILERKEGDKNMIESISFETTSNFKKMKKSIAKNIDVEINKNSGQIVFNLQK